MAKQFYEGRTDLCKHQKETLLVGMITTGTGDVRCAQWFPIRSERMNMQPGGITALDGNALAPLTIFVFQRKRFYVVLVLLAGGGFSEFSSSELNLSSEN